MAEGVFVGCAALLLAAAGFIVRTRRVVHAAFAFFVCLAMVAVLFVLAGADVLAAAQVIIYVGGILVLLLFGVMLSRRVDADASEGPQTGVIQFWPALLLCTVLFALLVITFGPQLWQQQWQPAQRAPSTLQVVGVMSLTDYLLPFELASVLLLLALVGAAQLARRPPAQPRDTTPERHA